MVSPADIEKKYGVSKSSANLYLRTFKKMSSKLSEEDLKNPETILEEFEDLKPATKRTYLLSVMRVLGAEGKLTEKEYDVLGKAYVEMTKDMERERKKTSRETPQIDFKQKVKILNEQIKDTKSEKKLEKLLQDKLIVLIHSEIATRRAMDWYDMVLDFESTKTIKEDDDFKENYYNGKVFIFKKYKTNKKHGVQVVKPTKRIQRTIKLLMDLREETDEDEEEYLFINNKGKKFTQPSWNKTLVRVLGVGTNTLRKIYANTHIDTLAVRKAMEVAKEMGHTIETAQQDYYDRPGEDMKNTREVVDET